MGKNKNNKSSIGLDENMYNGINTQWAKPVDYDQDEEYLVDIFLQIMHSGCDLPKK